MKNNTSPKQPRGQSLVEFAISLTAIMILLAGAVDFGIGLFHYIAMRDAAQEGALYGSMNPPATGGTYTCPNGAITNICARIQSVAGSSGIIQNIFAESTITVAAPSPCEGNGITVTFQYPYPISMPFMGAIIGSDHINLRASVTDTILTPPTCP
jgi:Flp pilus assembly protein TadG